MTMTKTTLSWTRGRDEWDEVKYTSDCGRFAITRTNCGGRLVADSKTGDQHARDSVSDAKYAAARILSREVDRLKDIAKRAIAIDAAKRMPEGEWGIIEQCMKRAQVARNDYDKLRAEVTADIAKGVSWQWTVERYGERLAHAEEVQARWTRFANKDGRWRKSIMAGREGRPSETIAKEVEDIVEQMVRERWNSRSTSAIHNVIEGAKYEAARAWAREAAHMLPRDHVLRRCVSRW